MKYYNWVRDAKAMCLGLEVCVWWFYNEHMSSLFVKVITFNRYTTLVLGNNKNKTPSIQRVENRILGGSAQTTRLSQWGARLSTNFRILTICCSLTARNPLVRALANFHILTSFDLCACSRHFGFFFCLVQALSIVT